MVRTAFVLFVCLSASAFAQHSAAIDAALAGAELAYSQAAYLVLAAAGRIADTAGEEEALSAARAAGWLEPTPGAAVSLGEFSLLVMKAFDLSGGMMYSLMPGPRYAARELAFRRWLIGSPDPSRRLSGREALHVISAVLNAQEAPR